MEAKTQLDCQAGSIPAPERNNTRAKAYVRQRIINFHYKLPAFFFLIRKKLV
jgi:hypothetical protein